MKKKIMLTMLCAMVGVGAISGCGASSTNTVKEETPVADPTATPEPQPTETEAPAGYTIKSADTEVNTEDFGADHSEAPADDTTTADSTGIRPEVKDFLDSYESFMNEYCDFMEKYENSDDVASMLNDYTEYMKKYADFTQKMDDMGSSDLNTEELKYYLDVQNRVSQRLLTVSGS